MDEERRPRLWIGTSGWVYPHWRGVFYPARLPTARWLSHYTQHFSTVELNNSFYSSCRSVVTCGRIRLISHRPAE